MPKAERLRLLLVEDDVLVRTTIALMLEEDGFRVAEAASASEAVRLMQDGLDVLAIVTDVDLGAGPNGMELADQLHALRPELAVVFITGRTGSLAGRQLGPREALLAKPFEGAALSALIRRMVPD